MRLVVISVVGLVIAGCGNSPVAQVARGLGSEIALEAIATEAYGKCDSVESRYSGCEEKREATKALIESAAVSLQPVDSGFEADELEEELHEHLEKR